MYANVRHHRGEQTRCVDSPHRCTRGRENPASVFTIATASQRVTVKTGFNDAGVAEILEGLKPDDAVILVGKQFLPMGKP